MKVKSVFLRSAMVLLAFAAGMYAIGLEAQSNHKTVTGMIKNESAAECTRMCVKDGQSYSLLVGKDVYTLAGHQTDLDQLAGQTFTVTGKLNGNTFVVESVIPVKK